MKKKTVATIAAPARICIYTDEDRPVTLKFFNEINQNALFFQRKLVIDLSQVTYASAAASTLMFAIVNRAQLTQGDANSIRFIFPSKTENDNGHRWIVRTGLSKALLAGNLDRLTALTENEQYFQSAVRPYEQYPKTVNFLDKEADLSLDQFLTLSTAISEAMINVAHHAYQHPDMEPMLKSMGGDRWWQCSWFSRVTNEVYFIICDLGLGAGKTFASGNAVSPFSDESDWVKQAFSYGGTRYDDPSRGNGSEDMKRPIGVSNSDNEKLLVFTGIAMYVYTSENNDPVCTSLPDHIPGTLVQWSLKRTGS
ncbi:hypothetical protein ACCW76_18350 [Pantoea sp. C8B4]|uniref:hypothetical protein n=1 Tax=Pantoea sp. C8B4 TaxID=3243083 RepID=UPI003ED87CF9